jgi:tetratricopeptide (TPR) repeat protein
MDHVEQVKQLKLDGRYDEAIKLLTKLVDATESESRASGPGWGVAPWYYEQLAIIYRTQKRIDDEVAILERYASQSKAPGVGPSKLAERLEKAKQLASKMR